MKYIVGSVGYFVLGVPRMDLRKSKKLLFYTALQLLVGGSSLAASGEPGTDNFNTPQNDVENNNLNMTSAASVYCSERFNKKTPLDSEQPQNNEESLYFSKLFPEPNLTQNNVLQQKEHEEKKKKRTCSINGMEFKFKNPCELLGDDDFRGLLSKENGEDKEGIEHIIDDLDKFTRTLKVDEVKKMFKEALNEDYYYWVCYFSTFPFVYESDWFKKLLEKYGEFDVLRKKAKNYKDKIERDADLEGLRKIIEKKDPKKSEDNDKKTSHCKVNGLNIEFSDPVELIKNNDFIDLLSKKNIDNTEDIQNIIKELDSLTRDFDDQALQKMFDHALKNKLYSWVCYFSNFKVVSAQGKSELTSSYSVNDVRDLQENIKTYEKKVEKGRNLDGLRKDLKLCLFGNQWLSAAQDFFNYPAYFDSFEAIESNRRDIDFFLRHLPRDEANMVLKSGTQMLDYPYLICYLVIAGETFLGMSIQHYVEFHQYSTNEKRINLLRAIKKFENAGYKESHFTYLKATLFEALKVHNFELFKMDPAAYIKYAPKNVISSLFASYLSGEKSDTISQKITKYIECRSIIRQLSPETLESLFEQLDGKLLADVKECASYRQIFGIKDSSHKMDVVPKTMVNAAVLLSPFITAYLSWMSGASLAFKKNSTVGEKAVGIFNAGYYGLLATCVYGIESYVRKNFMPRKKSEKLSGSKLYNNAGAFLFGYGHTCVRNACSGKQISQNTVSGQAAVGRATHS